MDTYNINYYVQYNTSYAPRQFKWLDKWFLPQMIEWHVFPSAKHVRHPVWFISSMKTMFSTNEINHVFRTRKFWFIWYRSVFCKGCIPSFVMLCFVPLMVKVFSFEVFIWGVGIWKLFCILSTLSSASAESLHLLVNNGHQCFVLKSCHSVLLMPRRMWSRRRSSREFLN